MCINYNCYINSVRFGDVLRRGCKALRMEPKSRIHFGSLEEKEKVRIEAGEKQDGGLSEAVRAGIQAGNINIAQGAHYLESLALEEDKTFAVLRLKASCGRRRQQTNESFKAGVCLLYTHILLHPAATAF